MDKEQVQNQFNYEINVMGFKKVDFMEAQNIHKYRFMRFLDAIHTKNGNYLEIGCGGGVFSYNVLMHCPNLHIYATDISKNAVSEAKNYIGTQIIWFVSDGIALPIKKERFDILALMDVVEHVQDINMLFLECNRILARNGIIHANVPCERNRFTLWWFMEKIKFGYKLTEKHLGHIQKLTTAELLLAINQAGFQVESIRYSRHFIGQLLSLFGFCIPKEILSRFFGATISSKITDYSISKSSSYRSDQSRKIQILLILRKLWYFILRIVAVLSYYESIICKRCKFMATDIHITCTKGSN
ncbi:MAG: class I SAM-dependent methyltransferase [bacterium]|nr:class I SAM-dependent methyltransferase [bacterium]